MFVRTLGLKIFNHIIRSDTPGYAPLDRTLGLNTIVRSSAAAAAAAAHDDDKCFKPNYDVENFQPPKFVRTVVFNPKVRSHSA